ncbi:hypothetical protein RRG08_028603 [Elysia crispata]|uniref:Uncharacterized protein n=1 Tax=Elysia crispata TaxID=231223 RepID=A0AAE1DLJ5_9GAST|nr:hypothetical protein RRG08_028603 [Elysia crispata]
MSTLGQSFLTLTKSCDGIYQQHHVNSWSVLRRLAQRGYLVSIDTTSKRFFYSPLWSLKGVEGPIENVTLILNVTKVQVMRFNVSVIVCWRQQQQQQYY